MKNSKINAGRTHDGKDFDMFQKCTHRKHKAPKAKPRRMSGRSACAEFPNGLRRGEAQDI